jgi:hypothetical protein
VKRNLGFGLRFLDSAITRNEPGGISGVAQRDAVEWLEVRAGSESIPRASGRLFSEGNPEMSQFVICPACGSDDIEKVKYTWWGGVIGPAMLHHVRCRECRTAYNGNTGNSNTPGIVIYSIVVGIIAFAIFFALYHYI